MGTDPVGRHPLGRALDRSSPATRETTRATWVRSSVDRTLVPGMHGHPEVATREPGGLGDDAAQAHGRWLGIPGKAGDRAQLLEGGVELVHRQAQ